MNSASYGLWQIKKLAKRTQSDKVFRDKAFEIASDPKYYGFQRGLASMVYKFYGEKSSGSGITNEPNYQLANKPIILKFKKRKIYSSFRDNVLGVDLADMQWVVTIKDKKGVSIVNEFQRLISEGRKPNKIWVEQVSEFYNNSFKDFLERNNIEMYSIYNEGKSAFDGRFIRTLKNKTFKHMTAISKNVYFDVLDDIVNTCNNTVHRTIKMKPIDVTSDSFAECNEDFNKENPKFKIGYNVRISKYKNIFAKGYARNWSEQVFVVSGIKNAVLLLVT